MEYVRTLTLDDTMAFIKDHRPSQFYSEILRIRVIKYGASMRAITAADKNPDMEIPKWYSWCESKHEYLGQLSVDLEENRHQLIVLLKLLRALLESIQRATGNKVISLNKRTFESPQTQDGGLRRLLSNCLLRSLRWSCV
jgi:hypothetical protein